MADCAANPDRPAAEPTIVRFWWFKRITLTLVAFAMALVTAWTIWDQYSRYQLRSRIAAYQKAGEPTRIEDLQQLPIPDDQNAALLYRQAIAAITPGAYGPSSSAYTFGDDLPYRPEWHAMAKYAAQAHSKAIELARQASMRNAADWGIRLRSPLVSALPTKVSLSARELANILSDTALYEHFHGDDARALADIQTVLHEGDMVGQMPFLISQLVGLGIENLAVARLQIIGSDLRIAPVTHAEQSSQEPSREQIRQFIAILLDGNRPKTALHNTMQQERVFGIDTLESCAGASLLLKPSLRLDTVRSLDRDTEIGHAVLLDSYPAAKAAITPLSPLEQQIRQQTYGFLMAHLNRNGGHRGDPAMVLRMLLGVVPTDRVVTVLHRHSATAGWLRSCWPSACT